jgi:hypothetical protein
VRVLGGEGVVSCGRLVWVGVFVGTLLIVNSRVFEGLAA